MRRPDKPSVVVAAGSSEHYVRRTAALQAYVQDYGPKGWVELVAGPLDPLDGRTYVVCVRRKLTPMFEAETLLGPMPETTLQQLYDDAVAAHKAYDRACTEAHRVGHASPEWPPFPEWP